MLRLNNYLVFYLLIILFTSCKIEVEQKNNIQIAFISDVHLSNIYGEFEDSDYKGVKNPGNGKYVLIRTMKSQLHSTRIFNENYFAFLAALDDVVKRNIKYVVLPGDFSDDGQPYNVRGLKHILDRYTHKCGIQFFAITGNHDPVAPFSLDAGKTDFLGEGGKNQAIMSKEDMYTPQWPDANPVVITKDICKMGYQQIVEKLENCGFYPQKYYRYWETPFSNYSYNEYSYQIARAKSGIDHRYYSLDDDTIKIPDVSYLVEPIDGLWLLALDGNVFQHAAKDKQNLTKAKLKSGGEYSNIIKHKQHLITWVKKVMKESKRLNKKVVAFSHYPMVDFNDGASIDMKTLFGDQKMQLHRVPDEDIAELFAKLGIQLHFGGHMHMNDTGVREYENGSLLVNVQIPSLAGYPAAYKLLTIKTPELMEVETVRLDSVSGFNELFPLYENEYDNLQRSGVNNTWNKEILKSGTYDEFISWHLKELVRLRFLEKDWPQNFKDFMLHTNGNKLLKFAGSNSLDSLKCKDWSGFDMIYDFYRIKNADQLAFADIGLERLNQYQSIINLAIKNKNLQSAEKGSPEHNFYLFSKIFNHLLHSELSDHFQIDLKTGTVRNLMPVLELQ